MYLKLWTFLLSSLVSLSAMAQIAFSLQLEEDGATYIVYARPTINTTISTNTIVGAGQVTIITPNDFQFENIISLGSQWGSDATVIQGPEEDPTHDYFSFGLKGDNNPKAIFRPGEKTALFSFQSKQGCQGAIRLIDNEKDDFAIRPNSVNSNAGNDLSFIDIGNSLASYGYTHNEEPSIVNCAEEETPLSNPSIEVLTNKSVAIEWASKDNVKEYEVRVRSRNTDEWLTSTKTRKAKIFLYVPTVQVYEYQIRTTSMDGTTEWSDVYEVNLISQ